MGQMRPKSLYWTSTSPILKSMLPIRSMIVLTKFLQSFMIIIRSEANFGKHGQTHTELKSIRLFGSCSSA